MIPTSYDQWEFQDPKMEVPTIYKAYVRPMSILGSSLIPIDMMFL